MIDLFNIENVKRLYELTVSKKAHWKKLPSESSLSISWTCVVTIEDSFRNNKNYEYKFLNMSNLIDIQAAESIGDLNNPLFLDYTDSFSRCIVNYDKSFIQLKGLLNMVERMNNEL